MHGRTLIGKNKTGIPIIRMFSTCQLSFSVTCRSQGYHYRSMRKKKKRIEDRKNKKTTMNDLTQSSQSEIFQTIDQFEYVSK
jgi:hypothetical protein